eukprot:scaffold169130_cov13-Tisochrysis_lutea.AAC.1
MGRLACRHIGLQACLAAAAAAAVREGTCVKHSAPTEGPGNRGGNETDEMNCNAVSAMHARGPFYIATSVCYSKQGVRELVNGIDACPRCNS